MAMSTYLATALLNAAFRNTPFTSPDTVYLALYTSDPTDEDIGTEVNGGGYARKAITFTAPVVNNGRVEISNDTEIVFDIATSDWGTVSHVGVRDAETGGNLLYYGALSTPREILTDDQLRFTAGGLILTLD